MRSRYAADVPGICILAAAHPATAKLGLALDFSGDPLCVKGKSRRK